jgi:hypothetical protein
MTRLRQLIREIHRRSLWQVLGTYVVGSWLLLQAVDTLAGALHLPDWASPFALFLLIIGFPIVLATAFRRTPARRPGWIAAGDSLGRSSQGKAGKRSVRLFRLMAQPGREVAAGHCGRA